MGKNPYCKMCDKFHWDNTTFYDRDLEETIYFCSEGHKNQYINKKRDPNFKTDQDKFMDEIRERDEAAKEKRRRKLAEIEAMHSGSGNSESYSSRQSTQSSGGGFFSKLMSDEETEEDRAEARRVAEEDEKFYAWLRKFWYIWIPGVIVAGVVFYFVFMQDEGNTSATPDAPASVEQTTTPEEPTPNNEDLNESENNIQETEGQTNDNTITEPQPETNEENQELDPEYTE